MKSSENQHSALKFPITTILGSKGHISVLRELFRSEHPVSHSELLDRTDLSRQGVYDITKRLVETGVISYIGSGRQQLVIARKEHPLYEKLVNLFNEETRRYETLIKSLQTAITKLEIQPDSAWIFSGVARWTDEYGDPVQIALLGKLNTIDSITSNFRKSLLQNRVESTFDVTIDISGITMADLETKPHLTKDGIIHLWGIHPDVYLNPNKSAPTSIKSHHHFDKKSLLGSQVWSALLKSNPEIIPRTISMLEKQIDTISSGEKMELEEWKNILENSSYQRLKKLIESDSQRSTRLRQSLPFWEVLTDNERKKFNQIKAEITNS